MQEAIDRARAAGESLGGVVEVWCWGTCPGLGGYANMGDRLDGRLFGALGSIPAIKAVEIGRAFENAGEPGSRVHDPFVLLGQADAGVEGEQGNWLGRTSNNAGGLEGGMTTGQPLVVRAVMKPIPTLTTPLPSVDISTMQPVEAHYERSDVTAVPAACVVAEAMVAYVLAGAYLDKFGGDSLADLKQAVALYEKGLKARGLWRRS
jgi:chorismate synthase